jgi:hypothetical protein
LDRIKTEGRTGDGFRSDTPRLPCPNTAAVQEEALALEIIPNRFCFDGKSPMTHSLGSSTISISSPTFLGFGHELRNASCMGPFAGS